MPRDYPERIEQAVDRFTLKQESTLSAGGALTLDLGAVPLGLTFIAKSVVMTTAPVGNPNMFLWADSISPDNLLVSAIGLSVLGNYQPDAWWVEGGTRFIAQVVGGPASALFGVAIRGVLVDSYVRLPDQLPRGSGFGMPTGEPEPPSQDAAEPTVLIKRDPGGLVPKPAALSLWHPVSPGAGDREDWPAGPSAPFDADPGY